MNDLETVAGMSLQQIRQQVIQHLRHLAVQHADAEDIAHTILTELLSHKVQLSASLNPVSWLRRAALSRVIDFFRSRDRRLVRDTNALGLCGPTQDPETSLLVRRAFKLIDDLPPGIRDVVFLCVVEGYTHDEIAQTLALPLGTVKSRLRVGLKRLRADVQVHGE